MCEIRISSSYLDGKDLYSVIPLCVGSEVVGLCCPIQAAAVPLSHFNLSLLAKQRNCELFPSKRERVMRKVFLLIHLLIH